MAFKKKNFTGLAASVAHQGAFDSLSLAIDTGQRRCSYDKWHTHAHFSKLPLLLPLFIYGCVIFSYLFSLSRVILSLDSHISGDERRWLPRCAAIDTLNDECITIFVTRGDGYDTTVGHALRGRRRDCLIRARSLGMIRRWLAEAH